MDERIKLAFRGVWFSSVLGCRWEGEGENKGFPPALQTCQQQHYLLCPLAWALWCSGLWVMPNSLYSGRSFVSESSFPWQKKGRILSCLPILSFFICGNPFYFFIQALYIQCLYSFSVRLYSVLCCVSISQSQWFNTMICFCLLCMSFLACWEHCSQCCLCSGILAEEQLVFNILPVKYQL